MPTLISNRMYIQTPSLRETNNSFSSSDSLSNVYQHFVHLSSSSLSDRIFLLMISSMCLLDCRERSRGKKRIHHRRISSREGDYTIEIERSIVYHWTVGWNTCLEACSIVIYSRHHSSHSDWACQMCDITHTCASSLPWITRFIFKHVLSFNKYISQV